MNWKSILFSGLVTGLVTLFVGLLLFWFQTKEPALVYRSITSQPFVEDDASRYIQQIDIINSGDTFLEEVKFNIEFPKARITDHGIKIDPTTPYTTEVTSHYLRLKIDSLYRDETVRISLILTTASTAAIRPNISLRAKKVRGQTAENATDHKLRPFAISLISAYVGLIAALLSSARGRTRLHRIASRLLQRDYSGEQIDNIASALAISGLPEMAHALLYPPTARRYWVEADLLAAQAVQSGDQEILSRTLKALNILAANKNMARSSKAIVMCNIARIHEVCGDSAEALTVLREARVASDKTTAERLNTDPILTKFIDALNVENKS